MRIERTPRRAAVLVSAGMVLAAGCGSKSFWVQQYPPFYTPELKTVAVVPFENRTPQVGSGGLIAGDVAAELARNGTYKVLSGAEVREIVGQTPLTDVAALGEAFKKDGRADAFVTGSVVAYDALLATHLDAYYTYGYHYHRWPWGWDWTYYVPHHSYSARARVVVSAALVRASDGVVLATTPGPLHVMVDVERRVPPDPERVLREAAGRVAEGLAERFAIVPVKVKVKPDKDFRLASGKSGPLWDQRRTFRVGDEAMYVVLHLPSAAERNTFRLTVTPKGREHDVVAQQTFVWTPALQAEGIVFSPRQIAAAAGTGDYRVNFYTDGARIMRRKFKVKQ